jgi:CheY-like chemotaxis protein
LDLILEVRELPGGLPVIVTGQLASRLASEAVRQWGADGYVALPVSREDLADAVRRALRGRSPLPGDLVPPGGDAGQHDPRDAASIGPRTATPTRAFHQLATVQRGLCDILLQAIRLEDPAREVVEELHRSMDRAIQLAHELPACVGGPAASPASGGGGMILLVEDNGTVRHLVRTILMGGGYTVLEAENGADALRVCASHAGPVDLLVADVLLPGTSGPRLFEQLGQRYLGLRALYLSGLSADVLADRGWGKVDGPLLEKPFTPAALLGKVGELLPRPAPPA